jgi:hypothetical protein
MQNTANEITIYIIQHIEKTELIYIGSTKNYRKRKNDHKRCSIDSIVKLYVMIRENGGWDMFEIRPIKLVSCNNSMEAKIEEEKCRIEYKANMNSVKAYSSKEEKLEACRKYNKDHYEEIYENKKQYRESNKEIIALKRKEVYAAKRDEQLSQKKDYYIKNKDAIIERKTVPYTCICGRTFQRCEKSSHEKSKFHINFVNDKV